MGDEPMGDTDSIELRVCRLTAVVGVLPEERDRAQPLEIDLDIEVDLSAAGCQRLPRRHRRLRGGVRPVVVEVVQQASHSCWSGSPRMVADAVLALDQRIESVTVAIRKLRPPVPHALGSSGVHGWSPVAVPGTVMAAAEPRGAPSCPSVPTWVTGAATCARRSTCCPTWWPCRPSTRPIPWAVRTRAGSSTMVVELVTDIDAPATCSGCATASRRAPSGCARNAGAPAPSTSTSSGWTGSRWTPSGSPSPIPVGANVGSSWHRCATWRPNWWTTTTCSFADGTVVRLGAL